MPDQPPLQSDGQALLIAVTRLEAKLDVALVEHRSQLDSHGKEIGDHEARLRAVEARPVVDENRLRAIEQRPVIEEARVRTIEQKATVTPLGLWSAVLGALGAAGVVVTIYNNLNP